jgi:hypothetical protein
VSSGWGRSLLSSKWSMARSAPGFQIVNRKRGKSVNFIRSIKVVAVAAVMITIVSGCTSSFISSGIKTQTVSAAEAATPKVGQCWATTKPYPEVSAWQSWDGSPAVKCTADHQFITMAVAKLPKELSVTFPEAGKPATAEMSSFTSTTCNDSEKVALPGDAALLARISGWNSFLPTAAEWKSGARFVRCDIVGVSMKSTFALVKLMNLPASVAAINKTEEADPLTYTECVNTSKDPASFGPVDDRATAQFVDCHGTHQWKLASIIDLVKNAPLTGYTNAADTLDRAKRECAAVAPKDVYFWVYPPAEAEWAVNHNASCWING